ncbi:MAG: PH domain-containing protein [Chloroflexi bacterium]|nr:PH domain-containing protein [Chloroflexota bacterium]
MDRLVEGAGGEQICLATRPHWFMAAKQGLGGLVLIVCGIVLSLSGDLLRLLLATFVPDLVPPSDSSGITASEHSDAAPAPLTLPDFQLSLDKVLAWGGIVIALIGALLLGWALLNRHVTEYAITMSTKSPNFGGRIVKVSGVLSRQTVSVPLGMVNNLVLYEPLLGRILGWGHIDIETGNDFDGDRLEYIPDPQGFHEIWKSLLENGYGDYGRHGRTIGSFPVDPYLVDPYLDADTGAGTGMTQRNAGHNRRRSGLRTRARN